jgi:hypothetical protein
MKGEGQRLRDPKSPTINEVEIVSASMRSGYPPSHHSVSPLQTRVVQALPAAVANRYAALYSHYPLLSA